MTTNYECILQLKFASFHMLNQCEMLDVSTERNEIILLYIEMGEVQVKKADTQSTYQEGEVFWAHKTDRIYAFNHEVKLYVANVWIDYDRLKELSLPLLNKAPKSKISPLWEGLLSVSKDSFNHYCKQQTLFWSLLDLITQEHTSYPGKMEIIIEEITNHIVDPHMEPLTVSELAKKANMTPASFSRAFKRHTGSSPKEFINSCRIKKAKELMREKKDITLKEVADLAGFQDEFYFSKLFKKKEGVAPSIFKKELP
ncbi:helix-turn-helix transcriptional regulator [Alkalihalophilus marmarensis]|uniref:helix-turn-helix transcriptional regulator n=1 Tax=Alkalihalophilus marmarensis TaxID=521377 RepID=UPI002E1ED909|nr:helix-turn-helix transcriptional regulator [Alkalihalophilus marmarensis]